MRYLNKFRNIIFLGHNGVMTLDGTHFEPSSVELLNDILKETKADICVTSRCRKTLTFDELQSLYTKSGVIKIPIGFTPNNISYMDERPDIRCKEIKIWLDHHPCEKWIAVDDMDLKTEPTCCENFIKCDSKLGLTNKEAEQIKNYYANN